MIFISSNFSLTSIELSDFNFTSVVNLVSVKGPCLMPLKMKTCENLDRGGDKGLYRHQLPSPLDAGGRKGVRVHVEDSLIPQETSCLKWKAVPCSAACALWKSQWVHWPSELYKITVREMEDRQWWVWWWATIHPIEPNSWSFSLPSNKWQLLVFVVTHLSWAPELLGTCSGAAVYEG